MKLGAIFPQTEIGSHVSDLRDYVQAVEGMGFDYLLAYDHVLGANPERATPWKGAYTHQDAFHEVFVLFSYAAAITETLEFTTGVLVLPQRPTALVAKQAAQLDLMSGGRLRLGVGIGWNAVEYEGLGYAFRNRARRIEEQVQLLRNLWTQALVDFEGPYHRIADAGLNPLPVQRPIPIWFGGGTSVPVMQRIAALADGWILSSSMFDHVPPVLPRLHEFLAAAGRDPQDFGLDIAFSVQRQPADTWRDLAGRWATLGASHLCLNTMGAGYSSLQQHLNALRDFKQRVEDR